MILCVRSRWGAVCLLWQKDIKTFFLNFIKFNYPSYAKVKKINILLKFINYSKQFFLFSYLCHGNKHVFCHNHLNITMIHLILIYLTFIKEIKSSHTKFWNALNISFRQQTIIHTLFLKLKSLIIFFHLRFKMCRWMVMQQYFQLVNFPLKFTA